MTNNDFKTLLSGLATDAMQRTIDKAGPNAYTGDDLINALYVLSDVAHAIAWHYHNDFGLTLEQRCIIAEEFGKNIRQSVTLFTGLDPHNAIKGDEWPVVVG